MIWAAQRLQINRQHKHFQQVILESSYELHSDPSLIGYSFQEPTDRSVPTWIYGQKKILLVYWNIASYKIQGKQKKKNCIHPNTRMEKKNNLPAFFDFLIYKMYLIVKRVTSHSAFSVSNMITHVQTCKSKYTFFSFVLGNSFFFGSA